MYYDENVTVTVRNLSGEVLLGPEVLPRDELPPLVRTRLSRPDQKVTLLHGEEVLERYDIVQGQSVELTATFCEKPLAREQRVYHLRLVGNMQPHHKELPSMFALAARNDPEVMMAIAARSPQCLRFGTEAIRSNPDIVRMAVQTRGDSLQFATKDLRSDPEIALLAAEQSSLALQFVAEPLKDDRQFVLQLLQTMEDAEVVLQFASERLTADPEVVHLAALRNPLPH